MLSKSYHDCLLNSSMMCMKYNGIIIIRRIVLLNVKCIIIQVMQDIMAQ